MLVYPDDFPVQLGASTHLTGEYKVFVNSTTVTDSFFIALTNSSLYHRFQTVDIKAVYAPFENVSVRVTGEDLNHTKYLSADSAGLVHYRNWTVPHDASLGIYMVNVTSLSNQTVKTPADVQPFLVPGFPVNLTVKNLAGDPVSSVTVEVFEGGESLVNGTSRSDGLVIAAPPPLLLEIGNYTCEAYYKNEKVGTLKLRITNASEHDFSCNLTNLRVIVLGDVGTPLPNVDLSLTPENQTMRTLIDGTIVFRSLIPNKRYTLNATRYDTFFNSTAILLPTLDWFNITITCPKLRLTIKATDVFGEPIDGAKVKAQEVIDGLYYEGETTNGEAVFFATLGKYVVSVSVSDTLLNETGVDLVQDRDVSIKCNYYGLVVSVKVVDYLRQPMPNVNVTFQTADTRRHSLTGSDGFTTFPDVIGGTVQIGVYVADQQQPLVSQTTLIHEPQTIEIRVEKYVALLSFLVETSHLATGLLLATGAAIIALAEIYRMRRKRS
jgi:hypothetical protein